MSSGAYDLPADWYPDPFAVYGTDRHRAVGHTVDLVLEYDPKRELDAELCNRSLAHGATCRCLRGHSHPHVPFSGELICTTGVYVRRVVEHGTEVEVR